jgi:hypothetical protein
MTLDLSALRDALAALDKSLGYLYSDLADNDPALREQVAVLRDFASDMHFVLAELERRNREAD